MESNKATENAELYQEGCTPIQFFSSPAIPVLPETPLEPRRGRPSRTATKEQLSVTQSGDSLAAATTEAVERIKSQVIALSTAERAELAYFLLTSLEPEGGGVEDAWRKEIARRATEIRNRQAVGRPIEEVLAELREHR